MGNFIDMTGWVMKDHGVPDSRLTVIERAEDYPWQLDQIAKEMLEENNGIH